MSQQKEVCAVRVRGVPVYLSLAGIVCWKSADPVSVLGYREVLCVRGPSGNGLGELLLTFVQPRSQPVVADEIISQCRVYAREWFETLR